MINMSKNVKKDEEKSKVSRFKEIWAVPRYKALIKLGLYVLFFVIMFLISYISGAINTKKNVDKPTSDFVVYDSYSYKFVVSTKVNGLENNITYTGVETEISNSGVITYSDSDASDNYVVDKTTDKIYVNGIEKEKLYEFDELSYFSLQYLLDKVSSATIVDDDSYVFVDSDGTEISVDMIQTDNGYNFVVDFNNKYVSEVIDGKTLYLEFVDIKQ